MQRRRFSPILRVHRFWRVRRSPGMAKRVRERVVIRAAAAVFGVAALALFAGCESVPYGDYEDAVIENNELRARNQQLTEAVQQSEGDKTVLQDRVNMLTSEVTRLESEARRLRATGSTPTRPGSLPTGATTRNSDVVVEIAADVLFGSGQASLSSKGKQKLDQLAGEIQNRYPNARIRVEGYSDSDPITKSGWKTNERLSGERAMAVEAYLVERGMDPDRVYSAAMGTANPKSSKSASRRVEVVVLGGS